MYNPEELSQVKSQLLAGDTATTKDVELAEAVAEWITANSYNHLAAMREGQVWLFGPKALLYSSPAPAPVQPAVEEVYRPMAAALIRDRTYALNFRTYDAFTFYLLALEEAQKAGKDKDKVKYKWEDATVVFWVE